tara:strand:- start:6481 stop:7182 length:702 start_codon:yes stop_codon:yes gene_type:complete
MNILLYGFKGYVGSQLFKVLKASGHNVEGVGRDNFNQVETKDHYDLVIHCANSARRFYANTHPEEDKEAIFVTTSEIMNRHKSSNLLLISSLSCRTEANTAYGRNRCHAEKSWIEKKGKVIRLGPMYGGGRDKDTLHDIINDEHVYYSKNTKYAYCNVEWATEYIAAIIKDFQIMKQIQEIGASNTITLGAIAEAMESKSTFDNKNDDQFPLNFDKGPDAYLILGFAKKLKYG